MKKTIIALSILMLSGCAVIQSTGETETDPTVTGQRAGVKKEFDSVPPPAAGKPISVAVYSFLDKTGQRRPQTNVASLSTAVTQGAETFLIKALSDVGQGRWFEVVERVGIDNLTKERLIIRQMREAYEGGNAKPLMPMQFAGIIIEGGIVGYDTSTTSGGAGMRIFGIGRQTQWSTDTVTVSLRAVSVNTGKVVASINVQKTILSTADSATALKFFDQGTQAFEAEAGLTINEPGTYAVKAATEMAVVELIKEGQRKGVWDYKQDQPVSVIPPAIPAKAVAEPIPVISSEVKQTEEKKDELVQTQPPKTSPVAQEPPATPLQQSNGGKTSEGNKAESKPVEQPKVVEEVKKPVALFGVKQLKENAFVYKTADEKSQKTWALNKGTEMTIITPGPEGWHYVTDSKGHKGFVKQEVLIDVPTKEVIKK
jgi:curli production assembly/transport component CsgG